MHSKSLLYISESGYEHQFRQIAYYNELNGSRYDFKSREKHNLFNVMMSGESLTVKDNFLSGKVNRIKLGYNNTRSMKRLSSYQKYTDISFKNKIF